MILIGLDVPMFGMKLKLVSVYSKVIESLSCVTVGKKR